MDIEYVSTMNVYSTDLKPGDIFHIRSCDDFEIYLTVSLDDEICFVRLSDSKILKKDNFSFNQNIKKHFCKLIVEM